MILWILGLGTLGLYLAFIMMKNGVWRTLWSGLALIVLLGSLLLIHLNDSNHFGMKQVTTSTTQVIYSASPSKALPLLLYQDVGTSGKHNVYIYKTSANGKATHTKADYTVTNLVAKAHPTTAQITTVKKEWVYKSGFMKALFHNENNHATISVTNTFQLPKTWTTLTTKQAKTLAKQLKQKPTAAEQAKAEAAIAKAVATEMAKHPKANVKTVTKQVTAAYQAAQIQAAIKAVKAE